MSNISAPAETSSQAKRVDPGALGFGALALTTFVLSMANTNLVPAAGAAVLSLALFYGGLAQVLAGIWAFVVGSTFGGTAFISVGAFWLSFWWLEVNPTVARQAGPAGIGIYLLAWAIFAAYTAVAAVKVSRIQLVIFTGLTITFLALSIGAMTGASGLSQAGGWLGLVTAVAAWYGSAAILINTSWGKAVLPTGTVNS